MRARGCPPPYRRIGSIRRYEPALDRLIDPEAPVEVLAEGFVWSEGPVWIEDDGYLLLSDVPGNVMYRWSEGGALSVFLDPSGHPGPDTSGFAEPGSNGLVPGPRGAILMCDHGNRSVASLDLATRKKTFLATHFEGRRFNSPNDLVRARDGTIYFTDPPYGLEGRNASPLRELAWNGVYRLDLDGTVTLLTDALRFPNGILLSPDERTLYVALSDPDRAVILAFALVDGRLGEGRVFADLSALVGPDNPGLPDGMAIDQSGNLFATGPGGVHVIAWNGRPLGLIATGTRIANCTFGEDGRTLFLASDTMLARVRTKVRGLAAPR
ncbi:MAG TPA: SMP-30/gluconolactonase/LRE family protein [Allosphingosinicella sp.]|jgi:gluconolactonase